MRDDGNATTRIGPPPRRSRYGETSPKLATYHRAKAESSTKTPTLTTPMNIWALRFDIVSVRTLVWLTNLGRDTELTPGAHQFFADRYTRLATWHGQREHARRAQRFQDKADEHRIAGGGDAGPPFAAAMAMPRPRQWIRTEAIGRPYPPGGDDAA